MGELALEDVVIGHYRAHLNPGLAKLMAFAGFGVEVRAEGCELIDHEGRRYLDCLGGYGVFALGHRHPRVIEAVQRQLERQPLSGKVFFNPVTAELACELAALAPTGLEFAFFSNSGAEAVEAALKFARGATGRAGFVSAEGSYHGKTLGALSVTGREKYRTPFEPLIPGAQFVPFGDVDAAVRAIDDSVAAVIVEGIQGEGGIHVAPPGYLAAIRARTREVGALMILDEVQTGLGRTGRMFFADHEGIQPDILVLAKALGGGVMPIGATLGTPAVWETVFGPNPLIHTSTFGGNPLACAAALATLRTIREEGLCDAATARGAQLLEGLQRAQEAHPDLLAEVRGRGLMAGVEFAMDEVGELVIGQMAKRGVVAAYTLNNPRVIRFEPPLTISAAQIDQAVQAFSEAVQETSEILAALV